MRKFPRSIVSVLVAALSLPTVVQAQSDAGKSPADKSGAPTKGNVQEKAPATKAMDKASAPEKTGIPSSGTAAPDALPATKAMDKASSPDKPDTRDKQ